MPDEFSSKKKKDKKTKILLTLQLGRYEIHINQFLVHFVFVANEKPVELSCNIIIKDCFTASSNNRTNRNKNDKRTF